MDKIVDSLKRYPVVFACLLVLILFYGLLKVRYSGIPEREIEVQELSRSVRLIEQNVSRSATLEADLARLQEAELPLSERLIDRSELTTNVDYLYSLEGDMEITSLQQNTTQAKYFEEKGSKALQNYSTTEFKLDAIGSFEEAHRFLQRLENSRFVIRFSSVNFSATTTSTRSDQVEVSVRLLALSSKEKV